MMENRFKSSPQLLEEYSTLTAVTMAATSSREARRVIGHFVDSLEGERPTTAAAALYLSRFSEHSQNTRARYTHVLSAFFFWFSGERLPFKVKSPKLVPQDVPEEDVEALKDYMRKRKTHKSGIERDILIVDTLAKTGMRRGELAALRVGDLVLAGDRPALTVHAGKGAKDRVIPLTPIIRERLANYVRGKPGTDLVFGLVSKTVSHKIGQWAIKAGVPHIHTHSLRHKFGFDLMARGVSIAVVQRLMGHEDPKTTVGYLHVAEQSLQDAVYSLDGPAAPKPGTHGGETDRQAARVYRCTASLAVTPPLGHLLGLTAPQGEYFALDLESSDILVESIQVRSAEPDVPFRLMLFESDPRPDEFEEEMEDMVQMEMVTQRVYRYPSHGATPYANRDGSPRFHGAVVVGPRPITFGTPRTGERQESANAREAPVVFELSLRYSVEEPPGRRIAPAGEAS